MLDQEISAEHADWSREIPHHFWAPGRKLLHAIRQFQFWTMRRGVISACMCKWAAGRHRFWCTIAGAEIPISCSIGGGLLIPHPNGIVIHPKVKIGVNCLIFQQVTIGTRGGIQVPEIAGHVDIGAGAKILGPIRVGPHAQIGANAVVVADVPSRGIAVGIPAKLL
jgi:serine O-acetyltransferase